VDSQQAEARGLSRTRWRSALLHAKVSTTEGRLSSLKQIFDRVQAQTGVSSVEEFAERFVQANDANAALYQRCDQLMREADALRAQVMDARAQARESALQRRIEAEERRQILAPVDAALDAAQFREEELEAEKEQLEAVAEALESGLGHMLEALDRGPELRKIREAAGDTTRALPAVMRSVQEGVLHRLSMYARLRSDSAVVQALRTAVAAATQAALDAFAHKDVELARQAGTRLSAILRDLGALDPAHAPGSPAQKTSARKRRAAAAQRRREAAETKEKKKARQMSAAERRGSVDLNVLEVKRTLILAEKDGEHTTSMSSGASPDDDPAAALRPLGDDQAVSLDALLIGPTVPPPTVVVTNTKAILKHRSSP
jgi:hypothetical protein